MANNNNQLVVTYYFVTPPAHAALKHREMVDDA